MNNIGGLRRLFRNIVRDHTVEGKTVVPIPGRQNLLAGFRLFTLDTRFEGSVQLLS